MLPTGGVSGFLDVQTEIDLVCKHLYMTLRLHTAAHDTESFPRFAVFHHESGNNGVKRTFARRVNIRVLRIHRKKLTAILQHKSKARNDDPAAHSAIIALYERHYVAFIIGRAHANRIALIERRVAGFRLFSGVIWID